jgi:predicted Holliday junction resolvase-like endonuclease
MSTSWIQRIRTGEVINVVTMIFGIIAAYFLTIQSLKLELSAKAENRVVDTLDKRLSGLEILLTERTVSKEELFRMSQQIESRLTRIEMHLTNKSGVTSGTP